MKALVDRKEPVALLDRAFEFGMQFFEFGELLVAGASGHHASGIGFQQRQQVVDISQVLVRDFGDVGAAAHFHGHQALGGQHLEGFPKWRAADTVFLGQLEFVNPAAWLQLAAEDALTKQFSDFFVQGAGG